jgi:SAM-dependent methyltransferase
MKEKIPEMAIKGLNNKILDIIKKYKLPKNARILVLGCGRGAIEQKLLKQGYYNITSVDYFTDFELKNKCKFIKLDLNLENFAQIIKEKSHEEYDIIIAVEVIEHLFNPYNFLKNIRGLLSEKGLVIISTPNTHSFLSRVDYLITGYPTFFIAEPELGGHVSPIFHKIFKSYLDLLNLKILEHTFHGSFLIYLKSYKIYSFRSIIYLLMLSLLYYLLQPLMLINRKISKDTNSIYIITKK